MDIWDTAGQEKYRSLLSLYYKNADGVIITFDITNDDSFNAVEYWTK
jgi:Ras-related protein Rab-5C